MGIKKELIKKGRKTGTDRVELVNGRVKRGKERWKIISVYRMNQNNLISLKCHIPDPILTRLFLF